MPDRLCIECFQELDDEIEHGDRCLGCEEGQAETWPWEMWAEFEEVPLDELNEEED